MTTASTKLLDKKIALLDREIAKREILIQKREELLKAKADFLRDAERYFKAHPPTGAQRTRKTAEAPPTAKKAAGKRGRPTKAPAERQTPSPAPKRKGAAKKTLTLAELKRLRAGKKKPVDNSDIPF